MRMAVCIKQVPENLTKTLLPDGRINRDSRGSVINPADIFALEAALTQKERYGGQVDVFTMGMETAGNILKEAAALGADRIFLLSDGAFAGADTYATAIVLSTALRKLGPYNLIFFGRRSMDGETGQVPVQVAEMLGVSAVTNVVSIETGEGQILCRRLLEGYVERRKCMTPAVVSIMEGIQGICQPRLPSLAGLRSAAQKEIILLDRTVLGLPETTVGRKGSFTEVERVYFPDWDRNCRFYGMEEGVLQTAAAVRQAKGEGEEAHGKQKIPSRNLDIL